MPVEFELRATRNMMEDLHVILESWAGAYPQSTGRRVAALPLSQPAGVYFFGAGSVRGVPVTYVPTTQGGRIKVRLELLASVADWEMGYALLSALVATHGAWGTTENGTALTPEFFGDAAARAARAIRSDFGFLKTMLVDRNERELKLPTPLFELRVTQAEVRQFIASGAEALEFEQRLAAAAASLYPPPA